ncbi:MAG: hypothetical protein NVS4B7_14420 [Ktedonobacteraceae bacterium]
MDATTLASTQAIVIWTMLGLLLAWMVIFAVLAFRPHRMELDQQDSWATPSNSFPVTTASKVLHGIAFQTTTQQIETVRHNTTGEMEAISVI